MGTLVVRVAVVLTARPSWAKLSPVVADLVRRGVDVQLIVCASALLERYGRVVDVVRQEYPTLPVTEVWSVLEGATLLTGAKETGYLLSALADAVSRLRPDRVVVCADRHEVLAAAMAGRSLNLPVVHLQGGERSGSIDDDVRDAITQLAQVHCVATARARCRVYGLTGDWAATHQTGCPSIDLALRARRVVPVTDDELGGVGAIRLAEPFVVVLHHPNTDHAETAAAELHGILTAVCASGHQVVALWPGQDAGHDPAAKVLRLWQGKIKTVRNLPPVRFLKLLTQAAALVGNSSVGIREGSALGVPVVNVGDRQQGRERGPNVVDVAEADQVYDALARQVAHGRYPASTLYGDGHAAERIGEVICG